MHPWYLKSIRMLEKQLDYKFSDKNLLKQALTHSSVDSNFNYERLEFLGDSIISFFISEYLYKKFTDDKEGNLTIKRAQLVNKDYLSSVSKSLNLFEYINIQEKVSISPRIHTDIFESIVGAILLDSDYKNVSIFLKRNLIDGFTTFNPDFNYKGQVLTHYQKKNVEKLVITTNKLGSTDSFVSKINIENSFYFYGFGLNKLSAEQRASKLALEHIKQRDI